MEQSSLKIAMITPQWLKTRGGPTTYVSNLVAELRRAGHEVYVLTSEAGEGAIQLRGGLFKRILCTYRHLTILKPDIVHIHGRANYILPAWLYKIFSNRKSNIVITFHTMPSVKRFLSFAPKAPRDYDRFKRVLARFLFRRCDSVVSVSESIVTALNRHYKIDIRNYSIIHSASSKLSINLTSMKSIQDHYALHAYTPIFSTVGVMSWDWKVAGQQICIEAVDLLRKKFPNLRLLIAGDGEFREYLEDVVHQREMEHCIIFLGNVDFIPELLKLSDIYVHMALNEACPHAVIEAMHAGKPIIAANRGGIPEILENGATGLLIEPSAEQLAQTFERLIENKGEAERLAQNAAEYAISHLTWEAIAKKYLTVYQTNNCVS